MNLPGSIQIYRQPQLTCFFLKVRVVVDGTLVGELSVKETISLCLNPGRHIVRVTAGGLSKSKEIIVASGQDLRLVTKFSNLGIFGGLRLEDQTYRHQ